MTRLVYLTRKHINYGSDIINTKYLQVGEISFVPAIKNERMDEEYLKLNMFFLTRRHLAELGDPND